MNVTENLNAIRTASDASEAVGPSLEEAKTKLEEAQAKVAAAIEEARASLTDVGLSLEAASQATTTAREATEEHLQRSRELEHHGAVAHLEEAESYINTSIQQHAQNAELVQAAAAQLTEVGETAGKGFAGVAAAVDERLSDAHGAREGLEQARQQVQAAGQS